MGTQLTMVVRIGRTIKFKSVNEAMMRRTADQRADYFASDGQGGNRVYLIDLAEWESLYNLRGECNFVGKLARNTYKHAWPFIQTSQFELRTSFSALLPIVNHTGFLAIPPCQSSASMLRHLSSLPYGQTSGQECVLQRATPIKVHVGAAATVVFYSLDAKLSPPVHRGGKQPLLAINDS